MSELGPMPPTADVGPVAPDAGSLQPIAPGVWAWIGTGAVGNAGVIVDDDGITLVDTLVAPSAARALNAELQRFGTPVKRVVYTSSHVQSVGGSAVFWMAARHGRSQTSALLEQPVPIDAYTRLVPSFAHDYLATDAAGRAYATRPVSHVVDVAAWLTPSVMVVPVGGQQAENLVVLVPGAHTLFCGAFASFGTTPNAWDGDPETWGDALGELAALDATVIVPGAGPIGTPHHLGVQQAYLYACAEAQGDPRRIPDGPWDDWSDRDLDAVNVERAALLTRGEHAVPRTMLQRLGLDEHE